MIGRALAFAALLVGCILSATSAGAEDRAADSSAVRGVVELFTSQGCSSCPPAEAVLTKLAEDPGLVALAYHVDYWDYMGWADPHGSRTNTERQRAYAKAFNAGTIYTPQAIVNGRRDVIGSRAAEIDKAVNETTLKDVKASVALVLQGDRLHITADGPLEVPGGKTPVLMLITYDRQTKTLIDSGENQGMTLVNAHSVRDWRILGMLDGKPLAVDIPVSMLRPADGESGYAAVLQAVSDKGGPGPILAAAALEF